MNPDVMISTRVERLASAGALSANGLSWSAIFAGAVVALAVSVFLTLLAAGFGYNLTVTGAASMGSLSAFTPEAGAGAIAIQVISAALGGYLAGRLRGEWELHLDEAHFRDTAQGLIAWAVATVAGLVLFAFVITPQAERLAAAMTLAATTAPLVLDPDRQAHILAQFSFFAAIGMLLSAFVAAVAARLGGLRTEEMILRGRA